jgi:methylmalonyl-CoA mutase N-terminal domain/subunit
MNPVHDAHRQWHETMVEPVIGRFPERRPHFTTSSDIPLERVHLPADPDPAYLEKAGFPGDYPFTRGVQPTMYRGRFWTMRQYAGFSSAEESNRRYKYLLGRGQTGLSVAFDLPTQIGYDPDDPMALGEVGKVGVSIPTLDDMRILLDGIPLDKVSVSMTINAPAAILLAMVVAVAKEQGVAPRHLRGTVQNDILKEYIARGTYIFPPAPSMRLITDLFAWCAQEVPHWNTISISGYHIREAGSTAAQELAFTLADGITYVQAAIDKGLDVDSFAGQLSFFFNGHNNFLEEVAKFRAARRMWAKIMRHRFGATNPKSWMLRFHTQTGGSTLTAQQPENNIVRTALQALAAVMGGTQSLHTNSMDEALGLPTENSARIALRTQQIIAHESGVADTIDPLAGSYVVEYLTDQLEARANAYIANIDALGGMPAAIESGYINREIEEAAYQYQRDVEEKREILVGVNGFVEEENVTPPILQIDPTIDAAQRARVATVRARRDNERIAALRGHLATAARSDENLLPLFVTCVEADMTLGEICHTLRGVWGEFRPNFGI